MLGGEITPRGQSKAGLESVDQARNGTKKWVPERTIII